MQRSLLSAIQDFSQDKFVLLSGPRQVGKTTLAKEWLKKAGLYLNWDIPEDRTAILKQEFLKPLKVNSVVLDELHKYKNWKSWLKGVYDGESKRLSVLVTGSARLEIFEKGQDSLLGRYERLRLHPLTIGEVVHGSLTVPPTDWLRVGHDNDPNELWQQLFKFSGFPEPFLRANLLQKNRWTTQRKRLLLQQDLRDLSNVKMISLIEHLTILLPDRVGSPLSVNNLKHELNVAHGTVSDWLDLLERLFYCYRISPFSDNISRSLKKEKKVYLWDWTELRDSAKRFENIVASHLLKAVHYWSDLGYGSYELCFLRNKEQQEVDFVVCKDGAPLVFIECKEQDSVLSKNLFIFAKYYPDVPLVQLINKAGVDDIRGNSRVVSASKYLSALL